MTKCSLCMPCPHVNYTTNIITCLHLWYFRVNQSNTHGNKQTSHMYSILIFCKDINISILILFEIEVRCAV